MSRLEQFKETVSKTDILSSTNNGLDIYKKVVALKAENGEYKGLCPFHDERTKSFTVFGPKNSYKCFGCGAGGIDAIKFLQDYYGISFMEALNMAEKDFSIIPTKSIVKIPEIIKGPMVIDFEDMPFERKHKSYWNKYLLPEEYLRSKNVFAVRAWQINKRVQVIGEEEAVFAYWAEDIDKVKILRVGPNVDKKDKWRNNVPNDYLWGFPEEKVEELWIMKSVKDALVMNHLFGKNVIATQNEDAGILLENNYNRIENISNNKIVCYGSDTQAWHQSYLLTYLTGWNYFNTPGYMLNYNIVDVADVVAEFGTDLIQLELKRRGFL